MRITRREALHGMGLGIGAAACAFHASAQPAPALAQRPNIIFILADDLGYGDLGCYGQKLIQTPCLDRMATEGTRFTQCYSGSTVCAPSRCALMTGLHTGHAYIRGNSQLFLPNETVTVAEVLHDAGYATGLIGKWGLGECDTPGAPNQQGFDYFFGFTDQTHAHNYYTDFLWKNGERYLIPENVQQPGALNVAAEPKIYVHDLFAEDSLRFVTEHKDHPFFLYLAFTTPHTNNQRGQFMGDGMEVPDYGIYADRDWPNPQKGHAAMISRMDRDIGRLLDKLKELGIDDNTIVFFASDNGTHKEGGAKPAFFQSSGPLRGIKRDLYDGGIRIPMIVRGPGKIPAGRTCDAVWAFWDFLPTAASLAGAATPAGLDGISMAPVLMGGEANAHPPLYWEFHEGGFSQGVRMGNWKAIRRGGKPPIELYDLSADTGEQHDIAQDHPDIIAQVTAFLATVRTPSEKWPGPDAPPKAAKKE